MASRACVGLLAGLAAGACGARGGLITGLDDGTQSPSGSGGDVTTGTGATNTGGAPEVLPDRYEGRSCGVGLECGEGRSCCESRLVVGGVFPMGRSLDGSDACPPGYDYCMLSELPEHEATVASFYLDTFEVTVARFRSFVADYDGTPPEEGAGAHPRIAGSGWQSGWNSFLPESQLMLLAELDCGGPRSTWTAVPASRENHPLGCLSWYLAFAFCAYDGGRLPTEAEWEYAAAGGDQNRLFPWGAEDPRDNVTWAAHSGLYNGDEDVIVEDAAPVGTFPRGKGRWGQLDLSGNIREWVIDYYGPEYYGKPCNECANLAGGGERSMRGGSYAAGHNGLRAAGRFEPDSTSAPQWEHGLRCARDDD